MRNCWKRTVIILYYWRIFGILYQILSISDLKIERGTLGLKYAPEDNELRLEIAEALLENKRLTAAAKELDLLLMKKFKPVQVLLDRAIVEEELEKPEKAISYLEQALAFGRTSSDVWEHLGDNYGWIGRYAKAFHSYDMAIKYISSAEIRQRHDKESKKTGKKLRLEEIESRSDSSDDDVVIPVQKRIATALKKLEMNPNDSEAHLTLGHLYSKNQEYERAVPHFFEAIQSDTYRYDALTWSRSCLCSNRACNKRIQLSRQSSQSCA